MKTNLIKFLKKYHIYILFGLILILFLFTRFYKIAEVPGSVNQDEAVGAYDAYSLIMTGKDHHGNSWPLSFEAFEDWTSPLHTYVSIPSIAALGLNLFSMRLPVILFNLVGVILLYILVSKITKNKYMGLFAMLALTASTQNLIASRFAIPPFFQLPLLLGFLICAVNLLSDIKRVKLNTLGLLLSALFLIVCYPSQKLFTPLLLLTFGIIYFIPVQKRKIKSILIYAFASLLIMAVVYLPILLSPEIFNNRFNGISIMPSSISEVPSFLVQFAYRYGQYLLPEFAFGKGDLDPGFRMSEYPLVNANLSIFFYIGFAVLFFHAIGKLKDFKLNRKISIFLIALTLLAPLPGSLTEGINSSVRNAHFFPFIIVLASLGLFFVIDKLKGFSKYILAIAVAFVITIQFLFIFNFYIKYYNTVAEGNFKGTINFMINKVIKEESSDSQIYTNIKSSRQPYILYLFQTSYPPAQAQQEVKANIVIKKTEKYLDYSIPKIANFNFTVPDEVITDPSCDKKATDNIVYYVCNKYK